MKKKYNVLFFFTDQQRWDTCGCYGQPGKTTPHLDKMAEEGTLFENAYTCQPVCGPARSSLQTGVYPTETGCFRNDIALPDNAITIAHHLTQGGYKTGYIGKWHLASTNSGHDASVYGKNPEDSTQIDRKSRDFHESPIPEEIRGGWKDQWIVSDVLEFTSHSYDGYMFDKENKKKQFPENRYRVDVQTDWLLETLDEWKDMDDPFFLFTSYIEPHHQNDHNCYEGPKGSKQQFSNFQIPEDLKGHEGDWKENYPDYLGCIHSLDENLGRVRSKLKETGRDKDTIIIFTSDHGSHFKTRNGEYKRSCHNACTHIPLVIYHPDHKEPKRVEEMVSLIDLPATFLDFCDIDIPEFFQGESLKGFVNQGDSDHKDDVFIQISESQVGRCVRTREWCYSVSAPQRDGWYHENSESYKEEFLYDQKNDPHEQNNLIHNPEFEEVRKEMADRLKANMRYYGETEAEIV